MKKKLDLLPFFFGFWVIYFGIFWSKALYFNEVGDLVAGHVNIWGDWAAHLTMTTSIAERGLNISSPFLEGAKFSYPFLINAISALLFRFGFDLILAMVIPSFVFSLLLVFAVWFFYKTILKSKNLAILCSLIFLFNGGIGFYYWYQDVTRSPQPIQSILEPQHEYTRLDHQNLKWINVIDSMVIPQRAFVMGFPLALLILSYLFTVFDEANKGRPTNKILSVNNKTLAAGMGLGFLPLIHTHSFLATIFISGWWLLTFIFISLAGKKINYKKIQEILEKLRAVVVVLAIGALISVPIILSFFYGHVSNSEFIKWYPGWLAKEFDMNWIVFWFKNWTIVPLLALIGWWYLLKSNTKLFNDWHKWSFLPFFLLFIIANLWLLQPFTWDNTKLIIWSAVGFSALSGWAISKLWQLKNKQYFMGTLVVFLFIFITASGIIDSYWILNHKKHSFTMYTAEELSLVEWVRANTSSDSVWLTSDQHNHWLYNLTGRQTLLAYRGWLWTHGYDYLQKESEVKLMFENPSRFMPFFIQNRVDYVVVGPSEINTWQANHQNFSKVYTPIKQTQNYVIYSTNLN